MCVCVRRWYAGEVSRHEAEKRLRGQEAGVFLVRESESAPGEFSVSVRSVNTQHTHTQSLIHKQTGTKQADGRTSKYVDIVAQVMRF